MGPAIVIARTATIRTAAYWHTEIINMLKKTVMFAGAGHFDFMIDKRKWPAQ